MKLLLYSFSSLLQQPIHSALVFFFVALRLLNTKSSSVFATSVFRVYHKIWLLPRICILNCCFNIFGGDRESLNLSEKLQAKMAMRNFWSWFLLIISLFKDLWIISFVYTEKQMITVIPYSPLQHCNQININIFWALRKLNLELL